MTKSALENYRKHIGTGPIAEQVAALRKCSDLEIIKDDYNPAFMFSTTASDILVLIAQGVINPVEFAKHELSNRGLDAGGKWVGFDEVKKIHGI